MQALLADAVMLFHAAFVGSMVFGLVAVPISGLARWRWVRAPWWRWAHLVGMGIVALQVRCFLTDFEAWLRAGGGEGMEGSTIEDRAFVVRLVDSCLFVDVPEERLWPIYIVLFLMLLASLVWVRPDPLPWWPGERSRARREIDETAG
ncbi:MAG: DUF2784 domain-containing protein [Planctomycetota bacterium]